MAKAIIRRGAVARVARMPASGIKIGLGPRDSSRDTTPSTARSLRKTSLDSSSLFAVSLPFLRARPSSPLGIVYFASYFLRVRERRGAPSLNGIGLAPVNTRGSRKWDFSFGTQDSKYVCASTDSSPAIYARSLMREGFPSVTRANGTRRGRYYRGESRPADPKTAYGP